MCAAILSVLLSTAADGPLAYLPPGAQILAGVNVERVLQSEIGQRFLSQFKAANPSFGQLGAAGFDPSRELKEIVVAANAATIQQRGLAILYGNFSRARCEQTGRARNAVSRTVQGVKVFTMDRNKDIALACPDDSLIFAGTTALVAAAIARRGSPDPALLEQARQLRAAHDIWVLADGAGLSQFSNGLPDRRQGDMAAQMMRNLRRISGGISLGDNIVLGIDLLAASAADATALAGALQMMSGIAAQQQQRSAVGGFLSALKLRAEGDTVRISMSVPQEEVVRAVQSAVSQVADQMKASVGLPAAPARPVSSEIKVYSSDGDMGVVTLPGPKK